MNKKSVWKTIKSIWKAIVGLSIIFSIISFVLQISGIVDFWSLLVLPLYAFLVTNIPIYYAVLFVTALMISLYFAIKLRNRKGILDYSYGRIIVSLCETPKTTESLKRGYRSWHRGWVNMGEPSFYEILKRLEKKGFIEYVNGKWQTTPRVLEYVKKYNDKP